MITTNTLLFFFTLAVVFMLITMLVVKHKLDYFFNNATKNYFVNFGLVVGIGLIIFSIYSPYFFTDTIFGSPIKFTPTTGYTGDTLGGIMNPYIAITGVIFTFLAFWVQYKANEQQKRDLQIERFENKFYEMLKIHRDNVNEITIGKSLVGRKSFISMFNELKFTYYSVKFYYDKKYKNLKLQDKIDDEILYNISYLIFFFGIGHNSSFIVLDIIGEKYEGFFLCVEEFILEQQKLWRSENSQKKPIAVLTDDKPFILNINYLPCNG